MAFTEDTRTETYLTSMGVKFKYSNSVTLEQMSPGWEHVNLSRPKAQREDAIIEYAQLMEGGSPAPAPIICDTPDGYDVLDGVQRISAAQMILTTKISAYIVTSDSPETLTAIRVLSNSRLQGKAESPEYTRRNAVEVLVVDGGLSAAEVARMGGWKTTDVERIAEALKWGRAVEAIGGPKLSGRVLSLLADHTTLSDIAKSPEPIAKFLTTLKAAKFSADDAAEHIEAFFTGLPNRGRHKTLEDRLEEFVEMPEVEARINGRKSWTVSNDVKLGRALKSAITVLTDIEKTGDSLLNIDEFFRLVNDIDDRLHALAKNHKKANTARVPADRWAR